MPSSKLNGEESTLLYGAYSDASPVLVNGKESISRRQLVNLFDSNLNRRISRKVVLCIIDNDLYGLAGYCGLLSASAIPLMVDVGAQASTLQALIQSYKPTYIWLPKSRVGDLGEGETILSISDYCLVELFDHHISVHDSLALLISTSGSTGTQKFVRLSHANVISNATSIAAYLDLNSYEVPITVLPVSYSFGLSIIHSHLLVGATIAVTNKTFFNREFWDFLRNVRATSFSGVPYHFQILKKLGFFNMNLRSLRTLTQAGGRMEPPLIHEYAKYCASNGMRYFSMYGQAEASPRMTYLPSELALSKVGSIGIPVPGGECWLEDANGKFIDSANIEGELIYRGPNVAMGYATEYKDLVKGEEWGGILRTGDLAIRDIDGCYYVTGRLNRFIKLFGRRVNLLDVESFLLHAGFVTACSGKDDRLEIYASELSELEASLIKKLLINYLRIATTGVAIYRVNALPRNESGKIIYSSLRSSSGVLLT
jgi:acyl-coenzyme A synthetase/AMP-(fatty) acid ligase